MTGRHEGRRAPDLDLWETAVTAYRTKVDGHPPPPGSNQRTDEARRMLAAGRPVGDHPVVDLFIDPVCPYTWVVTCWLREVERQRAIDVRPRVMSLHLLNAGGRLKDSYRGMVGPSRVAIAVATEHGHEALRAWHVAFGERIFDCWRYARRKELQQACVAALDVAGLPADLIDAASSDERDAALRRSTSEAIAPVGIDAGTPVIHVDGTAWSGPILNGVPRGEAALRLFEAVRLLAGSRDFFELKRTRTAPPDVWYRPLDELDGARA